jgi:hypothetical protein
MLTQEQCDNHMRLIIAARNGLDFDPENITGDEMFPCDPQSK